MSSSSKDKNQESFRVLHVDDDLDHLLMTRRFLEMFDPAIELKSVSSPRKALQMLDSFECVVSDYKMPEIDGIEFARSVKKVGNIPFIIYTGKGSEEVASAAFEAGIDDYLKKEFEHSHYLVLAKRIRMAVGKHRVERARSVLFEQNAVTLKILQILNRTEDSKQALYAVISMVQQYTDMEVVALRLRDGDDYPYYVWKGFPDYFIKMENYLCARDQCGELLRDDVGNPILECMCGNIILGRFDPSKPFFTEKGSFWTNSTTELLASTTEEDRQARTRNTCNGEGYESVALIPLRNKTEVIGLLQLNDKRKDRLSLQMVQFLEGLAESVSVAIERVQLPQEYMVKVIETISTENHSMSLTQ